MEMMETPKWDDTEPIDDTAPASPPPAPQALAEPPRWDDTDPVEDAQDQDVDQSLAMGLGKSIPAAQAADVLAIADWSGARGDFVQRNLETLKANKRAESARFDVLKSSAPATAAWAAQDPYRAAATLDDIHRLAEVERSVQEYGFGRSMGRAFMSGVGNIATGVGRAIAPIYALKDLPYNLVAKKFGGEQREVPDVFVDNYITRYWEDYAKQKAPEELDQSILEEAGSGNYKRAGRILAMKFAANAPQQVVFLASALSGAGAAGLAYAGVSQAGETLKRSRDAGLDPAMAGLNATVQGSVEAAFENFGTFGIAQNIAKRIGQAGVKSIVSHALMDIVGAGAGEFNEEFLTQIAQRMSDRMTGVDTTPFDLKTILAEGAEAGLVGLTAGTTMTAPGSILSGVYQNQVNKQTQRTKDFYTALGDSLDATETRKKLPEQTRKLVEEITKGSPVQDILIPVEAFDAYFQSAKEDPMGFAASLGAQQSYSEAKENGGYVKIPTAVWASKVVGTDHYKALANDVKFSVNEMTVNEAKAFETEMKSAADARTPEFKSMGRVYDDFRAKAAAAGLSDQESGAHAMLMAKFAQRQAQIMGVSAEEIYQGLGIQINRTDAAPVAMAAQGPLQQAAIPPEFAEAFTPNESLDEEGRAFEEQAVAYAAEHGEKIYQHYKETHGNEVATDKFRKYFEPVGFTGLNTPAFHEPAAALRRVFQKRVEQQAIESGNTNVILMAGGSGAGKTSGLSVMGPALKQGAGMIVDSNLSNLKKARKEIADLQKKGLNPKVIYVFRDPVDAWTNGVMHRIMSGSDMRTVPLSEHLRLHQGAFETAIALAKESPDVITLVDNSFGKGKQRIVSLEELENREYNIGKAREEIVNETLRLFDEGKISAEVVKSALGTPASEEEGRRVSQTLRGRVRPGAPNDQVAPRAASAVPDFRTFQQSAIEQRGQSRVMFEVAPDPNNVDLANRWRAVTPAERLRISQDIASKIIPQILDAYGVKGELQPQIGGYLDDTNPSFALVLPPGTPPEAIVQMTKVPGFVFSQDGMMTVSETDIPGAEEKAVIKIELPAGLDFNAIGDLYRQLREIEVDGEKPISGHTTANNVMAILNYSKLSREELAEAVDKKLNGAYTITTDLVSVLWVPKEEYGYAGDTSSEGDAPGRQSPVQGDPNNLRVETSRLLSEALDRYEQGRGSAGPSPLQQSAVAPGKQVQTFQQSAVSNAPIFYSQLQRTLEQKMPNAAPVAMVRALIDPAKGNVKAEEVEWSGINEFLDGKKTVTKAELLDFLKQNQVEVKEVVKKDGETERVWGGGTKFSKYQLPGGENYREVLLTLPIDTEARAKAQAEYNRLVELGNPLFEARRLADKKYPTAEGFKSGHFDEPNIIAHVRMNDRTTADGKKVLFIEEVQSDWHQKGRDVGYRRHGINPVSVFNKNTHQEIARFESGEEAEAYIKELDPKMERLDYEDDSGRDDIGGKVPNAPFKKTWHELALKRMLRYAVDNGYDGIAWTTGEQQAERYDLSKQVTSVVYRDDGNGEFRVAAKIKGTGEFKDFGNTNSPESYVGKELGKRIREGGGKTSKDPMGWKEFSGLDLKVGGEGMKGFYDQIIPAFLNKYTKKWGGRVGDSEIQTGKIVRIPEDYRGPLRDRPDVDEPKLETVHSLDITPAMRESVAQGQPMFQAQQGGDPRAQVRFGDQSINIDLFKGADLSSLAHELGHIFARTMGKNLDVLKAKPADALTFPQRQFITDSEALLNWVKGTSFETLTVDQHEQIARGFESYLREGKAPSAELRGAFARFREWLLMIYRTIADLNVELTPEVRNVFDRMLATQEEIEAARQEAGTVPLFNDAKAVGMTDVEANRYARAVYEAQMAAEEKLGTKLMGEMKREEMKPYQDRKRILTEEITGEVNRRIEYIALSVLQRGALPDGERVPEGFTPVKLSRKAIVDTYGEERLDRLPKPHVYSRQGGIHPDEAAAIFGFANGEELLTAIEAAQPKDQLIESLVEQRLKAEFGDMRTDGTIATEAMKAIHNEKRANLLKIEMDHIVSKSFPAFKNIVRRVTRPVPSVEMVRRQAQEAIANKAPRDIYPAMYQRTEAKASREAVEAMLKGDLEAAFTAKLHERMNHELYRAAMEARENVDKMVDYFKRFDDNDIRARIGKAGGDYLEQIEKLLERFDFRKSTTLTELDRRKALAQWVEEQRAAGAEVTVPPEVLNEANSLHYKDTPYRVLTGLMDTVKQIEHLAGLKNRLLANDRARTIDEAMGQIDTSIRANHKVRTDPISIEPTMKERFFDKPSEFLASHAKMEFVAEVLDGDQPTGPVYQHVIKPLLKAGDAELNRIAEATTRLREIFGVYTKGERAKWYYKKIYFPGIKQGLYKPTILSIALNQRNPYNQEALVTGLRGLGYPEMTQDHIKAILDTLDEKDIRFVNEIGDLLESYWSDSAKLEERVNGIAPEKVVGESVQVKNGIIKGGYYPIKFDHQRDWVSMKRLEESYAKDLFGGHWAKAMTKQGHLKERTNTGGKPLRLDLGIISEHITNVIHDITHREAVIDVNRIINNDQFRDLISKTLGMTMYKEFQPWLNAVAGQTNTEGISWLESLASHAKRGVTTVALGLKVSSALIQTAGYANTVKEIGEKYALIGLMKMGKNGINLKSLWNEISEKSDEMKFRLSTYDRDVRETMSKMNATGAKRGIFGVADIYTADLYNSYFGMIGMMDLAMSIPSWLGAYEKAMDGKVKGIDKADEKAAALYADKVVRMTQSASRVMDLARIQRGNQVQKLFTMFYSQMSIQFNQFMKTGYRFGQPGGKADVMRAFVYMMFAQAVIADLIRGGGKDDDDEKWWQRIAKDTAFIPFETMIAVRDVVGAFDRYGYSISPATDVGETVGKAGKAMGQRVFGDKEEFTASDWKNFVKTFGYVFALPTGQAWKTAEYLHAWMQGDVEPDNTVQGIWQALVTGKKKE